MADELAIAIYKSIHEANEPRMFKNFHASSIAECPRSHYFKRMGVPPVSQPTAAKMLRWQAGHIIEEVVRPHLQKLYPDLKSNVRLTSKKLDLTGEYDNYSEANKLLIEVKSVSGGAVKRRKVGDDRYHLRDEQPYLGHIYQNHAYVLLLREQGLPVENITFLYVTLDGLIVSYETKVNDSIQANVEKRLKMLNEALKTNKLPACLCREDHPLWNSATRWCDFKGEDECCSPELLTKFKEKK